MIFDSAKQQYNYTEFLAFCEGEVASNEANPENVGDPIHAHYAKLNLHRMKRWNKTLQLEQSVVDAISAKGEQAWWVITEPWCGDSAQNLPIIAAIASACNISLKIVLRDENPDIIDQYLTNGTRSIPVLVSFDKANAQLFRWGPRPATPQELMMDWKANPRDRDFEAFELEMHQWYTVNKGKDTQLELAELVSRS